MSIFKRALCFVARKKSRTIVLLTLFVVIIFAVSSVAVLQNITDKMYTDIESKEHFDISLTSQVSENSYILQQFAENVVQIDGVEKYRFELKATVNADEYVYVNCNRNCCVTCR